MVKKEFSAPSFIKKVAERIIDDLRLGNTDNRVMTNHELVNLVVGLVYKYNDEA